MPTVKEIETIDAQVIQLTVLAAVKRARGRGFYKTDLLRKYTKREVAEFALDQVSTLVHEGKLKIVCGRCNITCLKIVPEKFAWVGTKESLELLERFRHEDVEQLELGLDDPTADMEDPQR